MKKEPRLATLLLAALAIIAGAVPAMAIPPACEDNNCDWCEANPCENGACYQDGYDFGCSCYSGWTGFYCSTPLAASHDGMTWTLIQQYPDNIAHVGADSATDAYNGDTSASTSLPILCIYQNGSPVPSWLTPNFYNGWSKGHLALTYSVAGTSLTSLAVADGVCSGYLGAGWRMAEFHDGWYGPGLSSQGGWSYLGFGTISSSTRFWVYINDQLANPWN